MYLILHLKLFLSSAILAVRVLNSVSSPQFCISSCPVLISKSQAVHVLSSVFLSVQYLFLNLKLSISSVLHFLLSMYLFCISSCSFPEFCIYSFKVLNSASKAFQVPSSAFLAVWYTYFYISSCPCPQFFISSCPALRSSSQAVHALKKS